MSKLPEFQKWLNEHLNPLDTSKSIPEKNKNKNSAGGLEPNNNKQKQVFKKVDLITLPEGVEGTNCWNCEYITKKNKSQGFCAHEDIQQWVTKRMCCAKWDHPKVKRSWD